MDIEKLFLPPPALCTDLGSTAAVADVIVVRQVNVKDELSFLKYKISYLKSVPSHQLSITDYVMVNLQPVVKSLSVSCDHLVAHCTQHQCQSCGDTYDLYSAYKRERGELNLLIISASRSSAPVKLR